jgi:hypothetical protein
MRKLLLALIVAFIAMEAGAQVNRGAVKRNNKRIGNFKGVKSNFSKTKSYSAIGLSINALNYYGDLAPKPSRFSTDISFTRPAIGASFLHRFGPRYSVLGQLMLGTLRGSDAESANKDDLTNGFYRYKRNLSFRNNIKELSVTFIFDLFKNDGNYISRVTWTPYAFVGIAGFISQPQAQAPATDLNGNALPEAGKWVNLRPLGTEGQYSTLQQGDANYGIKPYSQFQVGIPFGLGARLRLTETLDLWADIGFRYTFTDYLDDVSRNYVDLGVLKSPLAQAMSYRTGELKLPSSTNGYDGRDGKHYTVEPGYGQEGIGNMRGGKNQNDIYMVTSIRITHIIGATYHRAKFR